MGKKSSRSESSKSDRKFEKKLEFYAKVRDKVASLGTQKVIDKNLTVFNPFETLKTQYNIYPRTSLEKKKLRNRQKKLKAYDLSVLSEFLPEVKTKQQPTAAPFKLNSKSRQNLLVKETNQMRTVLHHPVFHADPWTALHQHLQSTEPVMDEKTARKGKSGKTSKGKKSKGPSRAQSMEISV